MSPTRRTSRLSDADALLLLRRADPVAAPGAVGLDERARADLGAMLTADPGDRSTAEPAATPTAAPPRRAGRRWVRPVLLGALPLAATTAVALVLAVGAAQPRGTGLASWTPVPATAPGEQVSDEEVLAWTSECTELTGGGVSIGGPELVRDPSARQQVLVDRRGELTYCLDFYRGAGTEVDPVVMLSGLRGEGVQQTAGTVLGSGSPTLVEPRGADVLVVGGDSTTVRPLNADGSEPDLSGTAYQQHGLAGPEVTGVDVVLTNGLAVTATLDDGLWGAWWPAARGDVIGAVLTVRTADGARTVDPATAGLDWGG